VLAIVFAGGLRKLRMPDDAALELRVTFVQPSIPQTMIWDTTENSNRFRQLIELTSQALTNETDLLLWPEAAVPNLVRYDEATRLAVASLARSNQLWMILGSDDASLRPGGTSEEDVDYFNCSFLINPDGEIAASYRKNHLVIFGEYVPLARWLPFVKWFTPITGGFTPGTKPIPFVLDSPSADSGNVFPVSEIRTATLICFEDVFPHLVRRYVDADTDFLVNLTNDGWFGEGSAQWQHAASAVYRAVENGVPLLRCCNNGLTCWVDARGRMREVFRDEGGSVYGAGSATWRIPLGLPGERPPRTFYNRHGDWFGWACVILTALRMLQAVLRRPKSVE
jgi:apolipoprotein N-acyltransferase